MGHTKFSTNRRKLVFPPGTPARSMEGISTSPEAYPGRRTGPDNFVQPAEDGDLVTILLRLPKGSFAYAFV